MNNLIQKGVVVSVILLFIGLAFAPSINANISKASVDSELVEVTTEVCGIDRVKHYTVKLTTEKANEVDRLFDNIRASLNESKSREETVEIFNEAVVELDKYGLLDGLSVKQAQRLVTQGYSDPFSKILLNKINGESLFSNNSNIKCLLIAKLRPSLIIHPHILDVFLFTVVFFIWLWELTNIDIFEDYSYIIGYRSVV